MSLKLLYSIMKKFVVSNTFEESNIFFEIIQNRYQWYKVSHTRWGGGKCGSSNTYQGIEKATLLKNVIFVIVLQGNIVFYVL